MEMVHDQHTFLGVRILLIDSLPYHMGEVYGRPSRCHLDPPLPRQRLEPHEQIGRALPCLFIIDARGLPRGCWDGLPGFCHELFAGLIQAYLRASGIVGTCVDLQHILHGTDQLGVGLRGDHPLLLLPRFELVFLRVARTHSALRVSTMSSSTSLSAHHVRVHRTRPSGGALQATAISWASWTPSSLRYGRPVGRLRDHAVSMPASTPAWRTRWTVAALVSKASAISASVQR